MHLIHTFGHLLGGTLLVAGTSIGVGMLALPLATAEGGFLPAFFIYLICWLFMLSMGLLILEACTWVPKDSNLITIAGYLLGLPGRISCWILYLYLFFCLMVAHVSGAGSVVFAISGGFFSMKLGTILYVLLFSSFVYLGTKWVDRINLILMTGLLLTYLVFVTSCASHIHLDLLKHMNWVKAWGALPVIFTAFGFQSLIPTLVTYMNRQIEHVRLAIILGTSIPFIIYVIWELLILGIVPLGGTEGLLAAFQQGENATSPLGHFISNPYLLKTGQIFAFFALTTSFMGISIAFTDFLADGFKVEKTALTKLGLSAIIFVLPTVIALVDPSIFIQALSASGGIGVALLFGALPILMVWSGRYRKTLPHKISLLPDGKPLLALLMVFVLIELFLEIV
ncbi:MAG: amino acid permease [Anaerolineae bacterium]